MALSEALRSNVLTDALVGLGLVDAGSGIGQFLRDNLSHAHMLIYGMLVALTILFMPDGVLGAHQEPDAEAPVARPRREVPR